VNIESEGIADVVTGVDQATVGNGKGSNKRKLTSNVWEDFKKNC
jgi:hypothetical protein